MKRPGRGAGSPRGAFEAASRARSASSLRGPSRNSSTVSPERTDSGSVSTGSRSEEHTSELQSLAYLVCRLLLEKKKKKKNQDNKHEKTSLKIIPKSPIRMH